MKRFLPILALVLLPGFLSHHEPRTFSVLDSRYRNGVANLEPEMCINGTCVTPTFRYIGGDADGTDWTADTYGETLTAAGSGGSYNQGSPFHGPDDDSVNPAGTQYWQASGNSFADVTTEDMVFEGVLRFSPTNNTKYLSKRNTNGYSLFRGTGGSFALTLDDGPDLSVVQSIAQTENVWYHVVFFLDRSGSGQAYINGVASGAAVDLSDTAGSLSDTTPLLVGANTAGVDIYDAPIAYLAMWKQASWLDTHLQATVAQERFQRLTGFQPRIAFGSPLWTSYTRATTAHVDKWEGSVRKLYRVGAGMPRMAYRKTKTEGDDFYGYLPETAVTNLATDSADFSAAAWTATNLQAIGTDTAVAPDGTTTADTLPEDGTAADEHKVHDAFTAAAATPYVFSAWAKAINRTWVRLRFWSATDGNASAYFNLSTGVVGATNALDSSGIEDWGNGWFRCWIRDTRTTAESNNAVINIGEADNDSIFDGATQDSLYVWGAQIEASVDYPTSYIATSGGTATRNTDVLYYKGDDGNVVNNQMGTMEVKVLLPDVDNTSQYPYILTLTDNGALADRVISWVYTAGRAFAYTRATGLSDGKVYGTSDVFDGDAHTLRLTRKTDSLKNYVDGTAEGSEDTDCGMPDDLDRIHIGTDHSEALQTNGLISDVKIYFAPTTED